MSKVITLNGKDIELASKSLCPDVTSDDAEGWRSLLTEAFEQKPSSADGVRFAGELQLFIVSAVEGEEK